jgi:hypothetical protein
VTRAIDRSRVRIHEELLENILVEAGAGSGKTQMLAERMAAGVAAGVHQVEHMAAVTFTRKAASELRGRFHLALERELVIGCAASPGRHADPERIARLRSALLNLERFFAGTIHSVLRGSCERPVESGVSPGFTELDEVQDLELRQRAWREFITNARAPATRHDGVARGRHPPKDLDSAFATICDNEDVGFAGWALAPIRIRVEGARKFWKELQKHLPRRSTRTPPARSSKPPARSVDNCVCRGVGLSVPPYCVVTRHVGPRVEDHPEMVGGPPEEAFGCGG